MHKLSLDHKCMQYICKFWIRLTFCHRNLYILIQFKCRRVCLLFHNTFCDIWNWVTCSLRYIKVYIRNIWDTHNWLENQTSLKLTMRPFGWLIIIDILLKICILCGDYHIHFSIECTQKVVNECDHEGCMFQCR